MQAPGFAQHPQHKVTITSIDLKVTVEVAGTTVASSTSVLALDESRYDRAYYLPITDINSEYMRVSPTQTYCPFKGTASYWHLVIADTIIEDAFWAYQDPFDECQALKDHAAFYLDKVSLTKQEK